MIIDQQFRDIVNQELKRQEMSRAELARAIGVGTSTVTLYLNGSRSPGPDVIEKFFAALEIRPELTFHRLPKKQRSA